MQSCSRSGYEARNIQTAKIDRVLSKGLGREWYRGHRTIAWRAYGRASFGTRTAKASPPILDRVRGPYARVLDANAFAQKIVEMHLYVRLRVDYYIERFAADVITYDNSAGSVRDAEHIYSGWSTRRGVLRILAVARDRVSNDLIVCEILPLCMTVHRDARRPIVGQCIVDD